jgi:CRP/FNR family transcriptional regulator
MPLSKIWYLRRANIFSHLTKQEMEWMDNVSVMRSYHRHDLIFTPNDRGDKVFLLKKGRVKVFKLSDGGRELTLAILEPGEIFGEDALMDIERRSAFAEALDDAYICVIKREDFEEILKNKPDLALQFTKLVGERLKDVQARMEELTFRSVPARLASVLLRLADEHSLPTDRGPKIDLKLTHQELANLIGSTRETTTSALNRFRKGGLIDVEKRQIIILSPEGLKKAADG